MWLRNYSHFRERRVTLTINVTIKERPRKETYRGERRKQEGKYKKHSELSKTEIPKNMEGTENSCRNI